VKTQRFFATPIYAAPLQPSGASLLNTKLRQECLQLRDDDGAGQLWSSKNYSGGFTSYASANQMQRISPTFAHLEKRLNAHVARLARQLEFELGGRKLQMSDCWVNIMPRGVAHSLHLHPLSVISGTYYVQTPPGAPGLKFEDPRLDRFMAAPSRRADASMRNRAWIEMPAKAGGLLLFESWLRHEVMANPMRAERISISFNYALL
jgi:uncharacterized protein (TIGR02466 family)